MSLIQSLMKRRQFLALSGMASAGALTMGKLGAETTTATPAHDAATTVKPGTGTPGTAKAGKSGKPSHKPQTATASAHDADVTASASTAPVSMVAAATPTPQANSTVTTTPEPAVTTGKQSVAHKSTTAHSNEDVLNAVHKWAAAWSAKNVKGYLAFYAGDFKIPGSASRADWEALRNDRISKPKSIQVGISNAKVEFIDDSHASVTFKQSYHATHLKTSSSKTLVLEKSGDNWLIQEESAGK